MIFKSINKTQLIILLSSFVIFVNSQKSIAQVAYTAVPFLETVLDVRMQALGNSFVSFYGNEGAYEINPASISGSIGEGCTNSNQAKPKNRITAGQYDQRSAVTNDLFLSV